MRPTGHARLPVAARVLLATALLLALLLGACRGRRERPAAEPGRAELPTVDVAPPPDARVDPSLDRQERRRAESFSGVMPAGFPASLPLPDGASLVDQGSRWVEVLVGRPPRAVREELLRRASAAGWQAEGSGDAFSLRRQARSVRVRLAAQGPSTRLRIEY